MSFSRNNSILFLVFGILGLLLFLNFVELPNSTFLLRELQNTGHMPLFGILSLLVLSLSRLLLLRFELKLYGHYGIALAATTLLAISSEVLQMFGPRDADLMDLLHDLVGAVSFLAVRWAIEPCFATKGSIRFKSLRLQWLLGGMILFLIFLAPLAIWTAAYIHRNAVFPQIASFDSSLANKFLAPGGSELKIVAPPDGWPGNIDNQVGRLEIGLGKYPGLVFSEPYPDWSGYDYLEFAIYSIQPDTVRLELRINDRRHNNAYSDRYNRSLLVEPGMNRVSISLAEVAQAPRKRTMDMANIRAVVLFAVKPVEVIVVYLDDMRLR